MLGVGRRKKEGHDSCCVVFVHGSIFTHSKIHFPIAVLIHGGKKSLRPYGNMKRDFQRKDTQRFPKIFPGICLHFT